MKIFRKLLLVIITLALMSFYANAKVLGSVSLKDGEKSDKRLSTVNGSVRIGSDCILNAGASTVNGSISVGKDSKTSKLSTVNGRVRVGSGCSIEGKISTVNGSISCGDKTKISGSISTVNGGISLTGNVAENKVSTVNGAITIDETTIEGNLSTVNGVVRIKNRSVVEGNLYIGKSGSNWFKRIFSSKRKRPLKIYVTGKSKIMGDIVVRKQEREIHLIISDDSSVKGNTEGVKIIKE